MLIAIGIILIIAAAYVLLVRCNNGKKKMEKLRGFHYAHRGLHSQGVPENSMSAFRAAKEKGYGIELDVHLLADGGLAVMHDSLMKRTTGAEGRIEELTTQQLKDYRLEKTEDTIPTFKEVLELFTNATPLIVELKPENRNHDRLAEAACTELDRHNVTYCIESFDPRCLMWLKKNRPDVVRGQLACNFLKDESNVPWIVRFCLTHNLLNFLTVPDFVAYAYNERKVTFSNSVCKKLWGAQLVAWTMRKREEHDDALKNGWISIFEKFEA